MRRAGRWLLGTVAVLAGLALVLVAVWDWNWVKGPLEARLSAALGREVRIEGDLDVSNLSWTPTVTASGIRVANAEWAGDDPTMFDAERVEMTIDLKRYWREGRIVLPSLKLVRPEIALVREKDRNNFTFGDPKAAADAAETAGNDSMPQVGQLVIEDGALRYDDSVVDAKLDTKIASTGEGGQVRLQGGGTYAGQKLALDLTGGSPLGLRQVDQPYALAGSVTVGNTRARLDGNLTNPFAFQTFELGLDLEGQNLAELFELFGLPAPDTPVYVSQGRLVRDRQNWRYERFQAKVGDSDLGGTLTFDTAPERVKVTGHLVSDKLELADLGEIFTGGSAEKKRKAAEAEAQGRVIPDAPLRHDMLRNADFDIGFRARRFVAPGLPLDDVFVKIQLENGLLELEPLQMGVAGGRVEGAVRLNARAQPVDTRMSLRLRNFELSRFGKAAGFPQLGRGKINGRIQLAGRGDSLHRMLGSSDGQVSVVMDDGQFSGLIIEAVGLDLTEALGTLTNEDQMVTMRCLVADLQVDDGLVRPRSMVLDTEDTLVNVTGSMNLKDERLDLTLEPRPKDASLGSARSTVYLKGTLGKPQPAIDKEELALRGAAAIALGALLTPLAGVLAFVEPGDGEDANCQQLVRQAGGEKP
ncbi:MAG TPA: AsmA family protein [Alphaproteobacteria bacterium]|nr:AsmA family protein [Alphaproteobacteria bacterium]